MNIIKRGKFVTSNKTIKCGFLLVFGLLFIFAGDAFAQRKSVSGAEVTGTFSQCYAGKYKGTCSRIEVQALGGGKIKVGFDLVYPFIDGTGGVMVNMGKELGEALIVGDKAVYIKGDSGGCKITLHFKRPGVLIAEQEDSDGAQCGFGLNVAATGTFKKTSAKKPKFEGYDL